MQQKVAIVTGGSGGIGKAAASLLFKNGYTVYELSRHGADADGVTHLTADVTDAASVNSAVATVIEREGRIDLLVNNAGFGISGAVECTSEADAKAQFDVNFFGQLRCIQAVLPYMRKQRCGHIVNLSSVAAPIAIPFQSFYSATKAAVNSLTLSLRNEARPYGVQVCAVQPGDVRTGFTAARKKSAAGEDVYPALAHAVAVMEHDEQTGMPPEAVARTILRAASARRPRPLYTVGPKYRVFAVIAKFLPVRATNYLVGLIYR